MPVCRFAPSPTGLLHVGNARVAVLNHIFAKTQNAECILRFDDTDTERSSDVYLKSIREDLVWLGLEFDREYRQSERVYNIEPLKKSGLLYACYETPEELELQRKMQLAGGRPSRYHPNPDADQSRTPHWRFRLNGAKEIWKDTILGAQSHRSNEFSDPVVVREDGVVLYTLASVMDDIADNISWIIRGKDHVSNTVVQRQIFGALGKNPDEIQWSHIPLLVDADGKPLSKRRGASAISHLRYQGIHPWSLVCALANTGKKNGLEYGKSFEELVSLNQFSYSDGVTVWNDNDCNYWERKRRKHMSNEEGVKFMHRHGWSNASEKHWEILKYELLARKEMVYWREVCNNPDMRFESLSSCESEVRTAVKKHKTWNVHQLTELTGYNTRDIGQCLRHTLTGLTIGPQVSEIIQCISPYVLESRI